MTYGGEVFNDDTCIICKGYHVDDFEHTMTRCIFGRELEAKMRYEINTIIANYCTWPTDMPLWFDTPTSPKNAFFHEFNSAHGLCGFLPSNISKFLKRQISDKRKRKQCTEEIDIAVKKNRFNKWHEKWEYWHETNNTDAIKQKIRDELNDIPFYSSIYDTTRRTAGHFH